MTAQIDKLTHAKPPSERLDQLLNGFKHTQLVYVAMKLGLADILAGEPKRVDELAQLTHTHAPTLAMLLAGLTDVDVLTRDAQGRFALTPVGTSLQTAASNSAYTWIEMCYQAYGDLLHTVQTGGSAFKHSYQTEMWQHYAQRADAGAEVHNMLARSQAQIATALRQAYDFSSIGTLVDVGGGYGGLLAALVKANPAMHGIVCDMPSLQAGAEQLWAAEHVSERCTFAGGDFLASVPQGGDAYLIMRCVRNWDDERATRLLSNCRGALKPMGRLLVVEPVVEPERAASLANLDMAVLTGGRDRTEAEHRTLFAAAGFALAKVISTEIGLSVLEGSPA